MEASPVRNRLFLVTAAILFSTGGVAIKAASLTGWQVASFRAAIAAGMLLCVIPEARRNWSLKLVPAALAYATTLTCFSLATRLTTGANAIFLQSTAPLFILLMAPWLLGERIHRSDLFYIAAFALGMSLLFLGTQSPIATAPNPALGNAIAVVSGVAWALTVIGLRRVGRGSTGNPGITVVALGCLFAFLGALPMAFPLGAVTTADVLVILYLGVVQVGLAYVLVTRAMRHVPAFEATTVLLLEPVLNPIWIWLVQHEQPSPPALAGGAIILIATAWKTLHYKNPI
jgi:drug/metabolite transporter (DMT)-like permease